jgi:RNA polymerase sigma-70 factor (sigma-E family)
LGTDTDRDFAAFVAARSQKLFGIAMALTGHRHQAEDLLQTVLARAYRRWSRIRGEPEAYVRRALYHEQVSRWRSAMHRLELLTDRTPQVARAADTDRVDLGLALRAALRRLAPKHRAVLVLRYLEGLSDEEIAEMLGCRPGTVRSQVTRALQRLRQMCPDPIDLSVVRR